MIIKALFQPMLDLGNMLFIGFQQDPLIAVMFVSLGLFGVPFAINYNERFVSEVKGEK